MRMRRHHAIELARHFQRLENIEKRKKEAEANKKKKKLFGFFSREGLTSEKIGPARKCRKPLQTKDLRRIFRANAVPKNNNVFSKVGSLTGR